MEYGYVRVSSRDQNLDRQIDGMLGFGIPRRRIYVDTQSGKDFARPGYCRLLARLRENDLVVIKSIDRLGRNYTAIIEEWQRITHRIAADILVLDMPLLDTRVRSDNLVGRFISDIVLQVLSFVAENERANIRARQAEGIACARLRGVRFGRPAARLPENFWDTLERYRNRELSLGDCLSATGLKRTTFYKYAARPRSAPT